MIFSDDMITPKEKLIAAPMTEVDGQTYMATAGLHPDSHTTISVVDPSQGTSRALLHIYPMEVMDGANNPVTKQADLQGIYNLVGELGSALYKELTDRINTNHPVVDITQGEKVPAPETPLGVFRITSHPRDIHGSSRRPEEMHQTSAIGINKTASSTLEAAFTSLKIQGGKTNSADLVVHQLTASLRWSEVDDKDVQRMLKWLSLQERTKH